MNTLRLGTGQANSQTSLCSSKGGGNEQIRDRKSAFVSEAKTSGGSKAWFFGLTN
jgi:hypothetical protein